MAARGKSKKLIRHAEEVEKWLFRTRNTVLGNDSSRGSHNGGAPKINEGSSYTGNEK